jgi:hypothetical protein
VRPIIVSEQIVDAQSANANWNSQCASTGTPVEPYVEVALIPDGKNQLVNESSGFAVGSCQSMKPLPAPNMNA